MAEIRLICPGCAAEYRVPETAIPPEGREVECSACGNVWHAGSQPAPPALTSDLSRAPADGDEPPRLSRRLPDSVLDILRDEVEHERRARAAETHASPLPSKPADAPQVAADPEWPATTVTTAITRHVDPRPAEAAPAALQTAPKSLPPLAAPAQRPPAEPERLLPQAQDPRPAGVPAAAPAEQSAPAAPGPATAPRPARGGYGAGFGLAAMLAAGCVALYLLAPALTDQGTFGQKVMQLRDQVDQARLWLQDQTATLTR